MLKGSKGRFPYNEGKHLILVVRSFVRTDESGIHSGSKVCVVAGYMASPSKWKKFDVAWRAVLTEYRVPFFHGKVFYARKRINNPMPQTRT